jgi:hypothetical protein
VLRFFFRFFRSSAVGSRRRVLTSFPDAGAASMWLHHTRIEGLPPSRWPLQSAFARRSAPSKHLCTRLPSYANEGRHIFVRQ